MSLEKPNLEISEAHEKYQRYFRDLPQSFNPEEIKKDSALIDALELEFDCRDGKMLIEKNIDEKYIEKIKEDFIHSELQKNDAELVKSDLDYLNSKHEMELLKGRHDELTGLKNRRVFFEDLHKGTRKALGIDPNAEMNNEKWIEAINNADKSKLGNLFVMMSDISYLGLANDLMGHQNGDELLIVISKKMDERMKGVYRYGGDELTGVFDIDFEELIEKQKTTEREINEIKNLAGLEKFHLVPNVDIGLAHISEGVELFREFMNGSSMEKNPEAKKMMGNNALRSFMNLWLLIADKRSYHTKAIKRIYLLIDRASKGKHNENGITKGAYNISELKISELAEKYYQGKDISKEIETFIKENESEALKKIDNDLRRIQTEYVLKYLGVLS